MARDVSHAARVEGEAQTVASMVLDADTGLVRGLSTGASVRSAGAEAMRMALTRPAGPLPAAVPVRVVCSNLPPEEVRAELPELLGNAAVPELLANVVVEAEDIFDSFVGHLAGRQQPEEFPTPADWRFLFDVAIDYRRAEPWQAWSDIDTLDLVLKVDGAAARYVAVVLGQEGIQRGLSLYPGAVLPEALHAPDPSEVALPEGMLMLWLDPPESAPPEFTAKAGRYGWPQEADLVPIALTAGPDGPTDLDRRAAHRLTLAMAAVLARLRGPQLPGDGPGRTSGELTLADGHQGSYSIS